MCKFFSLVSDGKGKIMFFDWKLRQECMSGNLKYEPDSHTSIADYFGYKGKKEDTLNKYEYNPLTREFTIDQLNTTDDSDKVKEFCRNLDFKTIIPKLIVKPIIHPFKIKSHKVTKADIDNLHKWASVGASVWASVWASVGASVGDSVGAYISSFFDIEYQYDYTPANKLWERGFVPSYDGKTWRLHNKNGIVYKEPERGET